MSTLCGSPSKTLVKMKHLSTLLVLFMSTFYITGAAKILAIFHTPAYSHVEFGNALVKELALRHEVTLITPFQQNPPIKNCKTIVVEGARENFKSSLEMLLNMDNLSFKEKFELTSTFLHTVNELTLNSTVVQNLLKSNEKFDLLVMESFMNGAFTGFQHHYKVPCVLVSPIGAQKSVNYLFGNPNNPSYVADVLLPYGDKMTFFQRLTNTFNYMAHILIVNLFSNNKQNELLHKYFPDAPHITELIHNASLVLLNSVPGITQPLPLLPNMIEVGGLHLKAPQKLPEDLQKYLDESKQGVVYFSLGSNLRAKDMTHEKKSAVLKALSKLKLNVLWKFDEPLADLPTNVKIQKWLPQQEILAHPNVKLFVTHGGLFSVLETIYHGKPVLGIPHFFDQPLNVKLAVSNGCGLSINPHELNEETLTKALTELLNNNKYAKNAETRSRILRDQPMKPAEKAVYWIEYVIRHNGAYHLRSSSLDLTWWQYSSLDVIGFCLAILISILIAISYLVKIGISCLCQKMSTKIKQEFRKTISAKKKSQ